MPTTFEIHPAIGVARLGSSRLTSADGYFIGPEPDGPRPQKYRDSSGNLKRQAARFRIFECQRDEQNRLLAANELELNRVRKVTWTVHLANRKGVARRTFRSGPGFRNRACGDDTADQALIIDPGPLSIDSVGDRKAFDRGRFRETVVPLGEIFLETTGRLVVLGGYGTSGSNPQQPWLDTDTGHYADNSNWFDDTSDGPVSVSAELKDGTIAESTAWVIVGPPDFAPGITNLLTLYDVVYDLAVGRRLLPAPTDPSSRVSFTRHIQPILARAMDYRWVNQAANYGYNGGATGHGSGGSGDFSKYWQELSDPSPASAELRRSLVGRLRNPDPTVPKPKIAPLELLPRLSDTEWIRSGPGNVLPLTVTQYKVMQAWANGDFEGDFGRAAPFDEFLPDALDRVALEACVGGALQPGIEASAFILRDAARYMEGEPFRLSHALVRPGEVTQYNSLPWQTDFLACQWEEKRGPWPKRLGWWPAQRPDDVYPEVGASAMVPWTRGLGVDYQDMVDKWDRLGVVVDKGPPGDPFFVEDERDTRVLGP